MQRMRYLRLLGSIVALISCAACGGGGGGGNGPAPRSVSEGPAPGTIGDGRLPEIIEWARASQDVPAMAVVLVREGRIVERETVGRRSSSADVLAGDDDRWHIGSMTKAMTSMLAAVLVEDGLISWDSTPLDVWPEMQASVHAGFRDATLRQFLSHTSGMRRDHEYGPASDSAPGTVIEKRRSWAEELLRQAPEFTAGQLNYSNAAYVVAGAMLESRGGASWETLLLTRVFAALGMTQSGFGAPGTPGQIDQPLGHWSRERGFEAIDPGSPHANIPAAAGPAGNVHTTLYDYAQFMMAHLAGARGIPGLVSSASFETLHSPVVPNYALGWDAPPTASTLNVAVLGHTGSTGRWFSLVWLAPSLDTGVMIVTNGGGERAAAAIQVLDLKLRERVVATGES